ncbi:MAG: protein kinase, partial [Ignavibacterium sp.]|nr:protein kinase [Ignavibacterium sp.]
VVIKESNPKSNQAQQLIKFFRREAEYLRQISHQNIVKYISYFEKDNSAYLILEFIEGFNLEEFVKQKRFLKYEEAEKIFKQMCFALLEIHKKGIVHKDIKPNNFMLDNYGTVKLIDLGIAIDLIRQDPNFEYTFTKSYASPEQLKGNIPLDIRSDIYSLGKTFYYLLTGKLPDGDTTLIYRQDIQNEILEFKDPRHFNLNIPEKAVKIIAKCLNENRDNRYQSITEILNDLEEVTATEINYKDFNLTENFEGNFILDQHFDSSLNQQKYWSFKIYLKNYKLRPKNPTYILNLIHNYINRGNPTLCSLKLARWITKKYPNTIFENSNGVSYKFEVIKKNHDDIAEINNYLSLAAGIQNSLLVLFEKRILSFFDNELNFTIDDEYSDFFKIVVEDFLELAEHYFIITKHDFKKPEININPKTSSNSIHFFIDSGTTHNEGVYLFESSSTDNNFVIKTNIPVPYNFQNEQSSEEYLIYFLNNIFRFKKFRPGQLKIIRRALSLKNTVGLLPTGAGKSLCYQLIMFLQPAPIIIVEPIKSLIVDQLYNLKKFFIDRVNIITSDQSTSEREKVQQDFSKGRYLAIYVSPERFQSEKFRNYLTELVSKVPISYAVIDEAHCISEWGHDFRTSYLDLAKTIRKYCNHNGFIPTFYALTGTASEIVLRDILHDLEILDEMKDAVIRNYTFDRSELSFLVEKCNTNEKFTALIKILERISREFEVDEVEELFTNNGFGAGLIFCPHV